MSESSSEFHAFPLSDGVVVMRRGLGRLFLLNSSAKAFWTEHTAGRDSREIAELWTNLYGLELARARDEVQRLTTTLQQTGLLGALPHEEPAELLKSGPVRHRCGFGAPQARSFRNLIRGFTIQCSSAALEERVGRLFAHLEGSAVNPSARLEIVEHSSGYAINLNDREVSAVADLGQLMLRVVYHVGELGREDASQLFVAHAGSVARDDYCLLFPAVSGAGKTTLVSYLSHRGYDYLGDDMAPVDAASLQVEPAPTCLSVKSGSWNLVSADRSDLLKSEPIDVHSKQVRLLTPPFRSRERWMRRYPVRAIVCPRYRPEADACLQSLDPLELLKELVEAEAYFQKPLRPERIERMVQWLSEVPGYRLSYPTLADAARLIGTLL